MISGCLESINPSPLVSLAVSQLSQKFTDGHRYVPVVSKDKSPTSVTPTFDGYGIVAPNVDVDVVLEVRQVAKGLLREKLKLVRATRHSADLHK